MADKALLPESCQIEKHDTLIASNDYEKTFDFYPEKKIEFLVKGFSHLRPIYKQMREIAKIEMKFPIGIGNHRVFLQKEPENPYDISAISVWFQVSTSKQANKLGYIPKWLTKTIHEGWDRIGDGHIFQIIDGIGGKFTACRVVMGYDGYIVENLEMVDVSERFDDMIDEETFKYSKPLMKV